MGGGCPWNVDWGAVVGAPANGAFGVAQVQPDGVGPAASTPVPDGDIAEHAASRQADPSSTLSGESLDEIADPGTTRVAGEIPRDLPPSIWQVDDLITAFERLEAQVRLFHARAENYEQTIRRMQNRIDQLQGDQVQALLKPVIQRFAGLHAQARESSESARDRGEAASEEDFSYFAVAIEEALGLVDIESVGAAPSVEFDSRKHHAVRGVPTADPDLDKRVQRVLRQGFTYIDAPRVFLPARVTVYRYEAQQAPDDVAASAHHPISEPGKGKLGE